MKRVLAKRWVQVALAAAMIGVVAYGVHRALRPACVTRADCDDYDKTCSEDGTACVPDRAALLAAEMGIEPLEYRAPAMSVAQFRYAQGLAVLFWKFLTGDWVSEETLRDKPMDGWSRMMGGYMECTESFYRATGKRSLSSAENAAITDGCVAGAQRCVTDTPWDLTDPGGMYCWPEACILVYLEARKAGLSLGKSAEALASMDAESACYPGTGW